MCITVISLKADEASNTNADDFLENEDFIWESYLEIYLKSPNAEV